MSDYHLVSTLHAARVTLANARKSADADAVTAAEAQVAAARAAVDAALADGRVTSAAHLLDLDLDSLGTILSHLGQRDALSVSRTCKTLNSALFRGGLPAPLAGVCQPRTDRGLHDMFWTHDKIPLAKAALRSLNSMEPALGAARLEFYFEAFDEGYAAMLACALDAAPRAARIDIMFALGFSLPHGRTMNVENAGRLADVLSSPDRAFAAPPQVHLSEVAAEDADAVLRLTRAGVCVASIEYDRSSMGPIEQFAANAANTLTQLCVHLPDTLNLPTRFPALRRLTLETHWGFTTDVPSLTSLAPNLKEIEFSWVDYPSHGEDPYPPETGFGFEPGRFARFVAAIQGVTRMSFSSSLKASLLQNENENLRQLTALLTLRDLEIACEETGVEIEMDAEMIDDYELYGVSPGTPRAPVAEDAITNLPPLPPGLTRLALSGSTRVAFSHPLPELRVLDWRGSDDEAHCVSFYRDEIAWDNERRRGHRPEFSSKHHYIPLAIPSAAIAPNLHTLLIGYDTWSEYCGDFDLWSLVAARAALRVVVIEHARLLCSVPDGFDTTPAGFVALMARDSKALMSVHLHDCEIAAGHEPAVENFLRALAQRGGRVCRAGVEECMFCMLHDGKDLWSRW